MTETILHDLAAFDRALATHPRVLLFKHSPTCPISAEAREAYAAFRADLPDAPTLFVDVVADRPVARGILAASHFLPNKQRERGRCNAKTYRQRG